MSSLKLPMKPSNFLQLGLRLTSFPVGTRNVWKDTQAFRLHYKIKPSICAVLWGKILQKDLAPRARPIHLLMALYHLKVYPTDKAGAEFFGVHEDTFREWSTFMTKAIAKLKPEYVSMNICNSPNSLFVYSHASSLLQHRSSGKIV